MSTTTINQNLTCFRGGRFAVIIVRSKRIGHVRFAEILCMINGNALFHSAMNVVIAVISSRYALYCYIKVADLFCFAQNCPRKAFVPYEERRNFQRCGIRCGYGGHEEKVNVHQCYIIICIALILAELSLDMECPCHYCCTR